MKSKIYSADVLKVVNNTIKSGNYKLDMVSTPNELPNAIYISGAKVHLSFDEPNNKYVSILYPDFSFTKEDLLIWKTYPLGKYYHKDWNAINKGIDNYKLYGVLTFVIDTVDVCALIRHINKDEFETEEAYENFNNISINGEPYAIVKMFSPTFNEAYLTSSIFEDSLFKPKLISSYGESIMEVAKQENEEDVPDKTEDDGNEDDLGSVELF